MDEHLHQEEKVQSRAAWTPGKPVGKGRPDGFLGYGRRVSLGRHPRGLPEILPVSVRGTVLPVPGPPVMTILFGFKQNGMILDVKFVIKMRI